MALPTEFTTVSGQRHQFRRRYNVLQNWYLPVYIGFKTSFFDSARYLHHLRFCRKSMTVFFGTLSERRFKGDALLEINGSSVVFEFGRGAWRLSERGFLHGHALEFYRRVFACIHS
jgi:hypothetical protein